MEEFTQRIALFTPTQPPLLFGGFIEEGRQTTVWRVLGGREGMSSEKPQGEDCELQQEYVQEKLLGLSVRLKTRMRRGPA